MSSPHPPHQSPALLKQPLFTLGSFTLGSFLLGVLELTCVVALIGFLLGRSYAQEQLATATPTIQTTGAYATAYAATAQAIAHPAPTATPAAQLVDGPQLGGPYSDFDMTYGPEVSQGFFDVVLDGQTVELNITGNLFGDSTDGTLRVVVIDINGPDVNHAWSTAQDVALVAPFLPTDATPVQDLPGFGPLGPDHVYQSQQLAASLVGSVFTNSTSQTLVPGIFDWQCSTAHEVCVIGAGTNS